MEAPEEMIEQKANGKRDQFDHIVILIVLALLIGFLTGYLSHDHLVQFTPDHLDWKSWYPR